ncbi:hypothetical protein [Streptomyces shenzhenensis]|uniref:hypothetical protein n=1 Tax=Streptomyces shenzhenensis TaxID=943815 RepID=UPI00217EEB10|nr:hypothetical protein [Streptomyces shenzhenensis]
MISGSALATVIGVPVGTWAGQTVGWRGTFWALAALAAAAALLISRFVPADTERATAWSAPSSPRCARADSGCR